MTSLDDKYRGHELAGLQPERTALAWERTAFAMMLVGLLMSRYAADAHRWLFVPVGLTQSVAGAAVLMWARTHYRQVHGRIRDNVPVVHPTATRLIGIGSIAFTALALLSALMTLG